MGNCNYCQAELKKKNSKVCMAAKCQAAKKLEAYHTKPVITRQCWFCGSNFQNKDSRIKCCSTKCRYDLRASKIEAKYGVKNPSQIPKSETRKAVERENKSKASKKFWAERGTQIDSLRKQTMLDTYGVETSFKLPGVVERRLDTLETRYATRSARLASILKKLNLSSPKEFAELVIKRLEISEINPFSDQFKAILKNEFGVSHGVLTDIFEETGRYDLVDKFKSSNEREILDFLNTLSLGEIRVNTRPNFMLGRELDFYLPEHKFAIEFHGLAHHSLRPIFGDKNHKEIKRQHQTKYRNCLEAGVTLFQIFEDEWNYKRPIIESMLAIRLGKAQNKLAARSTGLKEIPIKVANEFFINNHIAGGTKAEQAFGLFHNESLVAALSCRKPWIKKYGENVTEIARSATKLNTVVVGGFQKLLKQIEVQNPTKLLSYCDLRFGIGNTYQKAGFELLGATEPNYFYERDGIRENRFKHRKTPKLAELGDTELKQQIALGWYPIYDAGSNIYLKTYQAQT